MAHPCCGSSLRRGVKIMAIIDIVLGVIVLSSLIVYSVAVINLFKRDYPEYVGAAIAIMVIEILVSLACLVMAVVLLTGADKGNLFRCKIWFIFMAVVISINGAVFMVNAITGKLMENYIVTAILSILYRLYMMWVVYAYIQELRTNPANTMQPEIRRM